MSDLPATVGELESITLTEFYWQHFHPLRHAGRRRPRTVEEYSITLRLWAERTGDPPLCEISDATLSRFLVSFAESRSGATINKYRQHLLTVLNFAGPRGQSCRNALGFISNVPWAERWPEEIHLPRVIPLSDVSRIIESCCAATLPMQDALGPHQSPAGWWRSLLVFVLNTAPRIGAVINRLGDANVLWDVPEVRLVSENSKTRREQAIPLNEYAMRVLGALRGAEVFWPWDYYPTTLWAHFRRIQQAAGLNDPTYGFHDFRRACSTAVAEIGSPELSQALLGHTSFGTTALYYLRWQKQLKAALDQLP